VKCRTAKNEKTVHCIVCNGCVRDFDHHCSWLNICINKENINWFRAFLYLFLAYILLNILFFVYNLYLTISCAKDAFFDIVFDLLINNDTYDFESPFSVEGEYKDQTGKYFWKTIFIIANGFILLGCVYVLIFILIPLIKYRIIQFAKRKRENYGDIRDRIGSSNAALLKERLTSENN